MVVEWGGDLLRADRHRRRRRRRRGPASRPRSCARPSSRSARPTSCCCSWTPRRSPGPADLELAERLRRARVPVLARREQARQPGPPRRGARVPRARARRSVRALGAARHRARATCSTRSSRACARSDVARVERTTDEIGVVILGRPNVGKSSLLNALCDEQRTIVSEIPGTTRDSIDIRLEREGRVYRLIDTAGLRRHRAQRQQVEFWSEVRSLEAARSGRRRARPDRLDRGHHRAGPARRRRRAPRELRDDLRALEVGHRAARARGRARAAAHQGAPAPADRRHLGAHEARARAARARDRRHLRPLRRAASARASSTVCCATSWPRARRRSSRAAGSRSTTARRCRRGRRASA